jgi:predicted DNA-binding protein with PD1-like motif
VITYESQRGRRILARIERNESVVDVIERIARDHTVTTGFVEAVGVLAELTVSTYDAGARARTASRTLTGPVELVSLKGTLASTEGVLRADVHVLVTKETELGPVVVGGHLESAEAISVDLVIHALDDLGVRRDRDERSGLVVMQGESRRDASRAQSAPAREQAPAREPAFAREPDRRGVVHAPQPVATGWAAAAAASASPTRGPVTDIEDPLGAPVKKAVEEDYSPAVGEYVDHRQFGLCRVEKVGGDGELLIRLETGRRKEIRIDIFDVSAPKMEGSRKVYALRPRRQG